MRMIRLGDHVSFLSGWAFKSALFNSYGDGVPVIRIRDVVRGSTNTFYSGEYDEKYLVKSGDLLIGMDGEFNLAVWRSSPALLNQRVCKVDRVSDDVDRGYLAKVLPRFLKELEADTPFVTVKHLSVKKLNDIEVALPPLDQQKRIAEILDAADTLRAKRRESLAQLDAFLQSTFLHMFGDPVTNPMGWESIPFGEVGEFFSGATPSKARQDYWVGSIPWVSPKDMKVSNIYDSKDHVSDDSVSETGLKVLEPGHLLIVIRGMILAHSFPVAINRVPVSINQDMKGIRASGMFCVEYLRECASRLNRCILSQVSSAGHGTRRLDSQAMKRVMVPVPPLELQLQFKSMVNAVEEQRSRMRAHFSELDSFFASLQVRAFNGEL